MFEGIKYKWHKSKFDQLKCVQSPIVVVNESKALYHGVRALQLSKVDALGRSELESEVVTRARNLATAVPTIEAVVDGFAHYREALVQQI